MTGHFQHPAIMKAFGRLLLALIVGAVVLAPIVQAQDVEKAPGYSVTPGGLSLNKFFAPRASGTISTGETDTYSKYVLPLTSSLTTDLNWGDTSDSLSLTIIAPDQTLGPYYDSSDGYTDGRIVLQVTNPGGYLTMGTWKFGVHGVSVNGVEDYTFVAY